MAATATRERPQQTRQAPAQTAPTGNLPATSPTQTKKHPVVQFKEYAMERIETLRELPHIDPLQLISVALTAIQRKPDLMKCTKQSLWNACVMAAQDGLIPDGREGAIVPYGENVDGKRSAEIATWMPMVEGLRKKVRGSGKVRDWYVELVYAGDLFRYRKGDDPRLDHEPVPPSQRTGGAHQGIVAAYSIAVFTDGSKSAPEVMWIEDIEKVRAKSRAKNGPWGDPAFYPEMCKKTVARRHYKQLPHTKGLDRLIERDDADYELDRTDASLVEQRNARRIGSTTAAFDQFSAPAIDHDDGEFNNDDSGDASFDQDTGEVDSDFGAEGSDVNDPPAQPVKPATSPKPADVQKPKPQASKEDPISSGPARGRATTANTANAAPPTADPEPPQEEVGSHLSGDPVDDLPAAEDDGEAEGGVGDDVRRWPPGVQPSTEDEYRHYASTKIADFQKAGDVAPWWKSTIETELRRQCGVRQAAFEELRGSAQARVAELTKAGKK